MAVVRCILLFFKVSFGTNFLNSSVTIFPNLKKFFIKKVFRFVAGKITAISTEVYTVLQGTFMNDTPTKGIDVSWKVPTSRAF